MTTPKGAAAGVHSFTIENIAHNDFDRRYAPGAWDKAPFVYHSWAWDHVRTALQDAGIKVDTNAYWRCPVPLQFFDHWGSAPEGEQYDFTFESLRAVADEAKRHHDDPDRMLAALMTLSCGLFNLEMALIGVVGGGYSDQRQTASLRDLEPLLCRRSRKL